MQQVALVQSGCQQWIRQPAAIHGDQFAFSSSLAVFVHASDSYRLLKLLAQQTQHINALCWSPVDRNLIACSNAEKVVKVYSLETDAAVYSSLLHLADGVSSLSWATHDENTLLAAASSTVAYWPYKCTAEWKTLHSFRSTVKCMQQSATEPRLLAIGCADASLHLFDMLLQKVVCTAKLDEAAVPCDLQFDPLSKSYLLLLCANGAISLYGVGADGCSLEQVTALAKQPAARRSAAFVPDAPGNFACINEKTGILQVWNVSQQQPLRSLKVGNGPAQSLSFFPGSSRALITFHDGTVIVYDVTACEQLWCTQPGHTETIFDCAFAAAPSSHLLATCSFDGTVRVWDATTHACIKTLDTTGPGRDPPVVVKGVPSNALYSVTWSPDCSLLAASSAGGAVYLFDYAKGIGLKKWQLHSKPSLRVTWHPSKPTLLASSSLDGSVVAFQTDGSKVKVLQHSSPASGCAWAQEGYLLATTSEAGAVYVWDVNIEGDDCLLHSLLGHAKRSFSVLWSPLLPHLLLSGSDDATARVWDTQTGSCVALLAAHSTEVRALCWHPDLPWLVLTGSWDSTIRCWDWRSESTVYVCTQHHSDVYGLSIHSTCPWLLASVSRDSTLRFWDLRGLAAGLLTRAFLEGAVPCGKAEEFRSHSTPALCGATSHRLSEWLSSRLPKDASGNPIKPAQLSPAAAVEVFQYLSAFFMQPGSTQQLWQLAAAAAAHLSDAPQGSSHGGAAGAANANATTAGELLTRASSGLLVPRLSNASSLSKALVDGGSSLNCRAGSSEAGGACGCTGPGCLCHLARVRSGMMSAANQLELGVRGRGVGRACVGGARRAEVLQEAAMMHLQAGDAERCCELLVEVEAWDKALAIAPAVSHEYWQQLLQRRADALCKAGASTKELLPHMLAAGQVAPAVELLMRHKQYDLAGSIAAVAASGGYASFAAGARAAATSPPPRSNSLMSPSASPLGFATSSSPTPGIGSSCGGGLGHSAGVAHSPTHKHHQQHQPLPPVAAPGSAASALLKRNSLPPLRGANLQPMCAPHEQPSSPTAAAAATVATGLSQSGTGQPAVVSPLAAPSSRAGSCSELSTMAHDDTSAADAAAMQLPLGSPKDAGRASPLQQQGCVLRQSFGQRRGSVTAVSAAASEAALAQLAAVCEAQVQLHRAQAQPFKAACAALTVHDVAAAVRVLHLGHEPEQAAMMCLALGRVGMVPPSLHDRVFEALAIKCEAAGDWWAAALALAQLHHDAQHEQQLLVVRQERATHNSSSSDSSLIGVSDDASSKGLSNGASDQRVRPDDSLRQQLQLQRAEHYAGLSRSTPDPLLGVRYLLLAGQHGHAAAKAVNSVQPLLTSLQQLLLDCSAGGSSNNRSTKTGATASSDTAGSASDGAAAQQLLEKAAVQQLMRWHTCLESLDTAALPPPCWHDVFAHLLLTGALRAFSYRYEQVGCFLLARLRHWCEEHQVQFPLNKPVLLLLEAELLRHSNPEGASSLLHAALVCPDVANDIRPAAEHMLQLLLGHVQPPSGDAHCVVANNSHLPHRAPPVTVKRSAVSGQVLPCGPWVHADDGCSLLSLSEAVMLSHVLRCGPFGTGLVLQLLV